LAPFEGGGTFSHFSAFPTFHPRLPPGPCWTRRTPRFNVPDSENDERPLLSLNHPVRRRHALTLPISLLRGGHIFASSLAVPLASAVQQEKIVRNVVGQKASHVFVVAATSARRAEYSDGASIPRAVLVRARAKSNLCFFIQRWIGSGFARMARRFVFACRGFVNPPNDVFQEPINI